MSSPQPTRVRRIRLVRRRKSKQPVNLKLRMALGLGVSLLLLGLAGWGWTRTGGLRGPRWMERWPPAGDTFGDWQPLEPGIAYARAHLHSPRPLRGHALRIDLHEPGLELVVPRASYAGEGETRAEWPMTWLREHRLRALINATPFTPVPLFPGRPTQLQGLAVSEGDLWSQPVGNLDNLVVRSDGVVQLLEGRLPVDDAQEGVGGFLIIRRDGENRGERIVPDATTVVGLSEDQRWMYWLVVDGGQPGYSEGVTPWEASELMGRLGASDAIRMDGGGSSALAVANGGVLNRPCHPVYDGAPRPVGNVLGIRQRRAR